MRKSKQIFKIAPRVREIGTAVTAEAPRRGTTDTEISEISERIFRHPPPFSSAEGGVAAGVGAGRRRAGENGGDCGRASGSGGKVPRTGRGVGEGGGGELRHHPAMCPHKFLNIRWKSRP